MAIQRFLIRSVPQSSCTSLAALADIMAADVTSHGCAIRREEDLSLVMGEICLAVEAEGEERQISDLVATWQSHGLRIDNADSEVHELEDCSEDEAEGEKQ